MVNIKYKVINKIKIKQEIVKRNVEVFINAGFLHFAVHIITKFSV